LESSTCIHAEERETEPKAEREMERRREEREMGEE